MHIKSVCAVRDLTDYRRSVSHIFVLPRLLWKTHKYRRDCNKRFALNNSERRSHISDVWMRPFRSLIYSKFVYLATVEKIKEGVCNVACMKYSRINSLNMIFKWNERIRCAFSPRALICGSRAILSAFSRNFIVGNVSANCCHVRPCSSAT